MRTIVWGVGLLLLAGCGGSRDDARPAASRTDSLTERERDSILAESRIPGARGVGKAMRVADSTSARARAADTVGPE